MKNGILERKMVSVRGMQGGDEFGVEINQYSWKSSLHPIADMPGWKLSRRHMICILEVAFDQNRWKVRVEENQRESRRRDVVERCLTLTRPLLR